MSSPNESTEDSDRRSNRDSPAGSRAEGSRETGDGSAESGSTTFLDLIAVYFVLAVTFTVLWFDDGSILRVVPAMVTLLVLPGYVTASALFPRRRPERPTGTRPLDHASLDYRERALLSIGLSVALVPLLLVPVGRLAGGFTTAGVFVAVGLYVGVLTIVAAVRRLRVPRDRRYGVPIGSWARGVRDASARASWTNRLLTIALVGSMILAGSVFAFALVSPAGGEAYTDFHLLTEDDDGEYVSGEYPTSLEAGEPASLTWGIENHEGEPVEYTVVVTVERVVERDGEPVRLEMVELDRTDTTVPSGEREYRDHEIDSPLVGDDLRLTYYLYVGPAPESPHPETAYRHLHLWIDVEAG